ncbi:MAG: sulfate ABC transporter permease subunit CysT [Deltaproteobacteria bacterium]|jgi:sulfate transport system permease protein|nr:sulfate ABC transporter permease subunit CysT [Deltaproteobacteria bacterium]
MRYRSRRGIPGFRLSLGLTVSFLSLMVLLPMLSIVILSSGLGPRGFWEAVSDPRVLAGYRVSFLCSLIAASLNSVFGLILAWVLVRYRFPGRRFIDGLIELPFALPTAVTGIALATLYSDKGWFGKPLAALGLRAAYSETGIILALTFITIPFVVRAVQPVLEQLDRSYEEAGRMLGASPPQIFRRVIFPEITPALLTGFGLSFARALGEYGSVVFIAGNMPFRTEIAPLLIMIKLEQFNYMEATAVALVMLAASFLIMFGINCIQSRASSFVRG